MNQIWHFPLDGFVQLAQKHRVGKTGMVENFRVCEMGVGKMGIGETVVGEVGVGEMGTSLNFDVGCTHYEK